MLSDPSVDRVVRQLWLASEVGKQITSQLDLDTLLARVVTIVGETLGYEHCAVNLIDAEQNCFRTRASIGYFARYDLPPLGLDETSILREAMRLRKPVNVPDVRLCEQFHVVAPDFAVRSELAVPLIHADRVHGVLNLESPHLAAFSEEDERLFALIADQIAIAIANAELYASTQTRNRELSRINEELEQSRTLYRDLIDASNDLIYARTLDGRITSINRAGAALFDRTPEDAVGMQFFELLGDEEAVRRDMQMANERLLRSSAARDTGLFEFSDARGRQRIFEFDMSLVFENGQAVGVSGVGRDVTEREALNRALENRAVSAHLLADLVTTLRDSYDLHTTLGIAARRLAEGLGVDRVHILLRTVADGAFRLVAEHKDPSAPSVLGQEIGVDDPDVAQLVNEGVQVVVTDRLARGSQFPHPISGRARNRAFVLTALRKGDATVGILSVASTRGPRFWSAEVLQILQTLADHASVSIERARLNEAVAQQNAQLTEANERLLEADRLRQEFTATLVHDIRSPMSAVLMTLDMLELQMGDPANVAKPLSKAEMRRMINAGQDSCSRILDLVNDLLDLSKADAAGLELSREISAVSKIVEGAIESLRPLAENKGIELRSMFEADLPLLDVDVGQVHRAVSNYISNAIKFTPEGDTIWIEARRVKGQQIHAGQSFVAISVVDSGPGIPNEEVPYLFDPYYQAVQARKSETQRGTGLGLAIVRRIAAAHGGNVSVRSQVGVGSVFTIILPVVGGLHESGTEARS